MVRRIVWLALSGWLLLSGLGLALEQVLQPQPVLEVAFVTVGGEHVRLSEWRGQPVLVTFWASDCGPCIAEIPELETLQTEYGKQGLRVIAIAMKYDLPSRVLALTQSAGVSYRVALDSTGTIAKAFGGVEGVPTTFLIASDGRLCERWVGPLDFPVVRHRVLTAHGEC